MDNAEYDAFIWLLAPLAKKKFKEPEPQPENFEPLKHAWQLDEYGEVDVFAGVEVDYHNGPRCTVCGYSECEHCYADIYSDTSCAYWQAWNEWHDQKLKVERRNQEIEIINRHLAALRREADRLFITS